MTRIIAVDPGPTSSAFVLLDGVTVLLHGKVSNEELKHRLVHEGLGGVTVLAIEMIACFGMPVGHEVFNTCVWIGRFIESFGRTHSIIYRTDVKLAMCGSPRAKDANIRQAVIDRYGGKEAAIGRKDKPGPLYGVKADVWQALAVGLTWQATGAGGTP